MSDKTIEKIMNYTNSNGNGNGKIPATDNVIKWNCLLARTYYVLCNQHHLAFTSLWFPQCTN